MKVLITGATGNVGSEVIRSLQNINHHLEIYSAVRNPTEYNITYAESNVKVRLFNFIDSDTYKTALQACDILFLLRPPQISDVDKYFKPLIDTCKICGVKHIVFLSVQGVEKSKIIPHHKIEKLIVESNIPYTFLRPAYFMQNFTTILRADLLKRRQIILPAGNAKFTLVDVRDIGAVVAAILTNTTHHANASYELTNDEKYTFAEMANILSQNLGIEIKYKSPNLLKFFFIKRKEKTPAMLIFVMIMLHYFPRFQKEPETTNWIAKLINKQPITFAQFVTCYKKLLIK